MVLAGAELSEHGQRTALEQAYRSLAKLAPSERRAGTWSTGPTRAVPGRSGEGSQSVSVDTDLHEEVFPCRACGSPVFDDEFYCEGCGVRVRVGDPGRVGAARRPPGDWNSMSPRP